MLSGEEPEHDIQPGTVLDVKLTRKTGRSALPKKVIQ